jgi:hypothetical protein
MVAQFPRLSLKWPFVSSAEIAQQIGVSADSLKKFRSDGTLQKGIYWTTLPGSSNIRWNLELIRDWAVNGQSPTHAKAVEDFLKSLASSRAA